MTTPLSKEGVDMTTLIKCGCVSNQMLSIVTIFELIIQTNNITIWKWSPIQNEKEFMSLSGSYVRVSYHNLKEHKVVKFRDAGI